MVSERLVVDRRGHSIPRGPIVPRAIVRVERSHDVSSARRDRAFDGARRKPLEQPRRGGGCGNFASREKRAGRGLQLMPARAHPRLRRRGHGHSAWARDQFGAAVSRVELGASRRHGCRQRRAPPRRSRAPRDAAPRPRTSARCRPRSARRGAPRRSSRSARTASRRRHRRGPRHGRRRGEDARARRPASGVGQAQASETGGAPAFAQRLQLEEWFYSQDAHSLVDATEGTTQGYPRPFRRPSLSGSSGRPRRPRRQARRVRGEGAAVAAVRAPRATTAEDVAGPASRVSTVLPLTWRRSSEADEPRSSWRTPHPDKQVTAPRGADRA